jgi:hypothetical protein
MENYLRLVVLENGPEAVDHPDIGDDRVYLGERLGVLLDSRETI